MACCALAGVSSFSRQQGQGAGGLPGGKDLGEAQELPGAGAGIPCHYVFSLLSRGPAVGRAVGGWEPLWLRLSCRLGLLSWDCPFPYTILMHCWLVGWLVLGPLVFTFIHVRFLLVDSD